MSNNRPLKSYIRYDGSGRAVSSSLIWRKNKPKVGNWKEVQGYECCNPVSGLSNIITCTTVDSETINQTSILFKLSGSWGQLQLLIGNNTSTTYEEFVEFLNTNLSSFGKFTYSAPDQICLQIASEGPLKYAVSIYPFPGSYFLEIISL